MSIEETRQLGIEFERRIQTMIPETEYTMKLDTETIYSFLNQFQDKFVHEAYKSLDQLQSGSKISARVETMLQGLIESYTTDSFTEDEDSNTLLIANLPTNFGLYLRSFSNVSSVYQYKVTDPQPITTNTALPNKLVSQTELDKVIENPHNRFRILKYPVVALSEKVEGNFTISLVHDQYTTIDSLTILYYKVPEEFSTLTNTPCELSMDVFDDLVTGAVDLYVQYVAGAEARRRQQQEAAKSNAENNNQ